MLMARSWGIAVRTAIVWMMLYSLGSTWTTLVLWFPHKARSPNQSPIFFSSQLFYPTCPKASKLQVSSKLIFLCPWVTSNSERLLAGACHIGNAHGRLHATMCLYLWGTEKTCQFLLPSTSCCFQLMKSAPHFEVLLGVERICESQEGKCVFMVGGTVCCKLRHLLSLFRTASNQKKSK